MKKWMSGLLLYCVHAQAVDIFNSSSGTGKWTIVNDGVMGGLSKGEVSTLDTSVVFTGTVSLKNNGGFTSIRYRGAPVNVQKLSTIQLRVKGDGKRYQFRIKERASDRYAYVAHFVTNGEWQTIAISLNEMYPSFRGIKLPLSNFSQSSISEIGFLIANKRQEEFRLEIATILVR